MALLNICGWEAQTTANNVEAAATAGTWSISTTRVRTGAASLRCNPASSAAGYNAFQKFQNTGTHLTLGFNQSTYFTVWINLEDIPSGDARLISINDSGSNVVCRVSVASNGDLTLVGATTSSVAATISADTWYRLDIDAAANATCGLSVNGGTRQTCTGGNFTIGRIIVGRIVTSEAVAFDCYYDDLWISDTAVAPNNGGVRMLEPSGAGSETGWTNGTGNTFAEVDDFPGNIDSDTTYIGASATMDNLGSFFDMETCASKSIEGAIAGLKGISMARTDSTTGTSSVNAICLKDNGTQSSSTALELTTTYTSYSKIWETRPSNGAAWTTTSIDAAEIGIDAGTLAQAQRCTALALMVWSNQQIDLPAISSGETLHALTLTPGAVDLTLPFISSGAVLYEPSLALGLVLPFISSTESLYAPEVTGAVGLTLPFISSGETLYEPTLIVGPVELILPFISSGAVLYAPSDQYVISLPFISSSVLYEPTLIPGPVALTLPFISSGSALYNPTLTPGAVEIILTHLSETNLYPPTVEGDSPVLPTHPGWSNSTFGWF